MHRAVKPRPNHLADAAGIVAVRLVDLCLEHRFHMPRLDTDHWQACFGECAEEPLRQRTRFQSNPLEAVGGVLQHRQQRLRFACQLTSRTILPVSSTMQTPVSLTETSSPAKWSMLRFSF